MILALSGPRDSKLTPAGARRSRRTHQGIRLRFTPTFEEDDYPGLEEPDTVETPTLTDAELIAERKTWDDQCWRCRGMGRIDNLLCPKCGGSGVA